MRRLTTAASLAALLAVWEGVCRLGWVSPVLLSPPSRIAATLRLLAASGAVNADFAATLGAFFASLAVALFSGVIIGVLMGLSKTARGLIYPYLSALNAAPKIALMPMVVLWFGVGLPPKLFLGALMGAFPIAMAAYGGVLNLENDTLMVARSFGASRLTILRSVVLPGLLPHVLPAVRVAINYVLVGVLTVEFFASDRGLGSKMLVYSSNFQTAPFFALLVVVVALAIACAGVVQWVENRLVGWRPEVSA